MISQGVNTYTYNLDGQLQSKTNNLLNLTTNYVYDVFGNLAQVTLEDGTVITYGIDGENRRISKSVNGILVRKYLWDQYQLVAEMAANGNVIRSYVYATRSYVPDYYVEGGVNYKIVTDSLGSPVMVINAATGTVIQTIEYDEFGRVISDSRNGELAIGFAGGLSDWDTKLVRFGVRDYDFVTGRWTAKDPILFEGGDTNLYGYVLNDPVNYIDSDGNRRIGNIGKRAWDWVKKCLANADTCGSIPDLFGPYNPCDPYNIGIEPPNCNPCDLPGGSKLQQCRSNVPGPGKAVHAPPKRGEGKTSTIKCNSSTSCCG